MIWMGSVVGCVIVWAESELVQKSEPARVQSINKRRRVRCSLENTFVRYLSAKF
jgi:hypothetical protein